MSPARVLVSAALAFASLGCQQEVVTMTSTAVREPGGTAIATLAPFTPLVVRAAPFGDKAWLKVVEGAPVGEVRAHHVAVLPLKTVDRYVLPTHVDVLGPGTTRRLPACARVSGVVYEAGDEGARFVLVEQGRPIGALTLESTAASPPSADAFIAAAETALRDLRPDDAERQADAALSCAKSNRAVRAMLAELAGRTSEARRAELLRHEAPWPPLPIVASGAPVAEGDVAFVADVDVALRAGPQPTDPTVSDLAIGTSVRVLAVSPPWAKVQSLFGDVVVDVMSPFQPQPPLTDAIYSGALRGLVREGYVPVAALARVAPDLSALIADAKTRGATAEAVVLWRRAAALAPADTVVRRGLVDTALLAGRPVEAVRGALVPAEGSSSQVHAQARVDVLFRCIGDVKKASVSDGHTLSVEGSLGDRCVTFDPRPPCLERDCPQDFDHGCSEGEHEHSDDQDDNEPDTRSAAVIAAEREAELARDEAEMAAIAAQDARDAVVAADERVRRVAEGEETRERAGALVAALPRGPLIRVTLEHLERLPADVELVLVQGNVRTLDVFPDTSGCVGTSSSGDVASCHADARAAWAGAGGCGAEVVDIIGEVVPLPLPKPAPQGKLVIFADAPAGPSYLVVQVPRGMTVEQAIADPTRRLDVTEQPKAEADCSCPVSCY